MSQLVSPRDGETVSNDGNPYNRKEKSLKVICAKFLKMYDKESAHLIELDDASLKLAVERRRIYDVINILESVGLVFRHGRNQYLWKGWEEIPRVLKALQEEGAKNDISLSDSRNSEQVSDEEDHNNGDSVNEKTDGHEENSSSPSKTAINGDSSNVENKKRGRSLSFLTQNFMKLYLCYEVDTISLDNAAEAVFDDPGCPTALRTKVRRLYDISNILSCLNLIQKVRDPESKKPAFRWVGWRGKAFTSSPTALVKQSNRRKKRRFGTEITNMKSKRKKVMMNRKLKSSDEQKKSSSISNEDKDKILENYMNNNEKVDMEQVLSERKAKGIVFGPFAPSTSIPRSQQQDSGVQPSSTSKLHYRNEALKDLFGHYKEAWNAWYEKISKKEPME